ncbi:MAG: hypothetical protein SF029_04665 [bacterium]|nr:hypothetical protein [bacterium]
MPFEVTFTLSFLGLLAAMGAAIWLLMQVVPPLTKRWLECIIGKTIDEHFYGRGTTWHIRGTATRRDLVLVYGMNLLMTLAFIAVPGLMIAGWVLLLVLLG